MGRGKQHEIIDIALGLLLAKGLGKLGKVARRLAFRWRRALAPLWAGVGLWLFAVLWRWLVPDPWWPLVLVVPVLGVTLAVLGPRIGDRAARIAMAVVPDTLDTGKVGVMDRPVERIYFGSLCACVGAWLAVRIALGPSGGTALAWQVGVGLFGGTWWFHRRIRIAGRADKYARKWTRIRDRDRCPPMLTPLAGSKVLRAEGGRNGVARLLIELHESVTPDIIPRLANNLASFYNLRPGAVFPTADESKARRVWLTFLPKDPWKGKLTHPLPEPGTISLSGMNKRLPLGLTSQAVELSMKIWHTQLVGANGSGKSGMLHNLMTWLVAATDAVVVGIDMAGEATLGVWKRCLALPLASDVASAYVVLERVLATIEDRERQLGVSSADSEDAEDSFEPTSEHPWLFLVIDEFPDLIDQARGDFKHILTMLGRIAKRGRKAGVWCIFASQNGTKMDWGSKEMQAQLRTILGLSLSADQSRNLWGSLENQGWRSTSLREGQFLLRDDEHQTPVVSKGWWVSHRERRAHAAKAAVLHKALEPTAWAALCGTTGVIIDVPVPRDDRDQPDDVLDYLINEGPARAEDLATLLGISRATVYRRLAKHQMAGRARSDNGTWRAVEREAAR